MTTKAVVSLLILVAAVVILIKVVSRQIRARHLGPRGHPTEGCASGL